MPHLTANELRRIERQHAEGIRSSDIVDIFRDKGYRFSEATLRKYVQLGLLPKSRRVGLQGRHRGSSGLYPVCVVRLVDEIKAALDRGATLEEVRFGDVGLVSEVEGLMACGHGVLSRFDEAAARLGKERVAYQRLVERERKLFQGLCRKLENLSSKMVKRKGPAEH